MGKKNCDERYYPHNNNNNINKSNNTVIGQRNIEISMRKKIIVLSFSKKKFNFHSNR